METNVTPDANMWLTPEVESEVRSGWSPWTSLGAPVVEHLDGSPGVDHRSKISRMVLEAPNGAYVVAALPPWSG